MKRNVIDNAHLLPKESLTATEVLTTINTKRNVIGKAYLLPKEFHQQIHKPQSII